MKSKVAAVVMGITVAMSFSAMNAEAKKGPKEIYSVVDLAVGANESLNVFNSLIAALVDTGLDEALACKGQVTVFAPTDAAFDAAAEAVIGEGATGMELVDALDIETLTNILLYHVAPGRRLSPDVVEADQIRMLSKQFTVVTVNEDGVFINDAAILIDEELFDLEADNGVVHVINTVLIPPSAE
jgi:uncharacterized surface protein with fasciclin (FAS1) repeats